MTELEELVQAGGQLSNYFTDAEVAQFKEYARPLVIRAWFDLALYVVELTALLGLGLNQKLFKLCGDLAGWLRAKVPPQGVFANLGALFEKVWRGPDWLESVLFVWALGLDFLGASAAAKLVNVATNLAAISAFISTDPTWPCGAMSLRNAAELRSCVARFAASNCSLSSAVARSRRASRSATFCGMSTCALRTCSV